MTIDLDTIKNALSSTGAIADTAALTAEVTYKAAGFDSLDLFNLLVELEQQTGHAVPDEAVSTLLTPQATIDYFNRL